MPGIDLNRLNYIIVCPYRKNSTSCLIFPEFQHLASLCLMSIILAVSTRMLCCWLILQTGWLSAFRSVVFCFLWVFIWPGEPLLDTLVIVPPGQGYIYKEKYFSDSLGISIHHEGWEVLNKELILTPQPGTIHALKSSIKINKGL